MQNVVYFTVNDTFFPMALANASVLIEEEDRNFDVVIFLEGDGASKLRVPEGVRVIPNEFDRLLPAVIDVKASWGRIAYTRIFGPKALAEEYQRALYLDADVAVFGPVSPLFNLDLKGKPIAAVESMMDEGAALHRFDLAEYKAGLGVRDGRTFNSAMLLIDIPAWNRADHANRLNYYTREVQPRLIHRIGKAGDQDYLNFALTGEWLGLSPHWKFPTFLLRLELEELFDPVIFHYAGPRRPWHKLLYPHGAHHSEYFDKHLRRIGFTDFATIQPRSYHQRHLADQVRQFVVNHIYTRKKRQMFAEWSSMRAAFKNGIEARLKAGQYEDVSQGLYAIDLSSDPFADVTVDDAVYYRKQIRLRSTL